MFRLGCIEDLELERERDGGESVSIHNAVDVIRFDYHYLSGVFQFVTTHTHTHTHTQKHTHRL